MNRKQHGSPHRSASFPSIGLSSRPLSRTEEEQILQDVRGIVWSRFSQAPQTKESSKLSSRSETTITHHPLWFAAPALAFCTALLVWWLPNAPVETLLLEEQSSLSTKQQKNTTKRRLHKRTLHLKTAHRFAHLQAPKRWKLRLSPDSSISIEQKTTQHHLIHLKKGSIEVAVSPGKIKLFEISLPHYHIHVKGTRFVVKRGATWWRIEMHEGRVQLASTSPTSPNSAPLTSELSLSAGQGARVDQKTGKAKPFAVPPPNHRSPNKRVSWWLSKNEPETALQWLEDHLEQHPTQRAFYARGLQEVAEHFRAQKNIPRVLSLLTQIYKLQIPGESELALPEALALCRQEGTHPACLKVFQLSIQQKNPGPFAEHALFWLAVGLSQQSLHSKKESVRLLTRYLLQFPKGEHVPRVISMLQQVAPSLPKLCKQLAAKLPPKSKKPLWWRHLCLSR